MNDNPELTADWDVVFDARGHLLEPHTDAMIPLGTLNVRRYLRHCDGDLGNLFHTASNELFPTHGPRYRYGAILFVEQEGFFPLFEAVKLAERYDIAIMSTKGMSNTASRGLVDKLCAEEDGIPLLTVHDFDKAGFSIAATLQRDTRRYNFSNTINVFDLGLRFEDVEKYGLESERVYSARYSSPDWNLSENGATDDEIKFLRERRVELNAFTSGDLVNWIESKLAEFGIEKVVPDKQSLTDAYRKALESRYIERELETIGAKAKRSAASRKPPANLVSRIRRMLKTNPDWPWDRAIKEIIEEDSKKESK